jgi:esterase/lipase
VTGDLYGQIHRARKFIKANTNRLRMPVLIGFAGEDEIADNVKNRKWFNGIPATDKTEITYPDARHILEYSLERERYFEDLGYWLSRLEEL